MYANACPNGPDSGDTAWLLISTALVLFMIPALAFFEGGFLRVKNMLSLIAQIFAGLAALQVMWHLFGFSLTFGQDHGGFIGDFQYSLYLNMENVCFPAAPTVPSLAFASFELMFAAITPLLVTGAFSERLGFRSFLVFTLLWELFIYYPLAHWVWGGGWAQQWGVLDFAGGIVIHTSAGTSALVSALFMGRRLRYDEYNGMFPAHNVPLAALGAAMLWFGWFGFNAGSTLASNNLTASVFLSTASASCYSALVWFILAWLRGKHVDAGALLNGAVAGLAGVTPACGYMTVSYSCLVGVMVGIVSYYGIVLFKGKLRIDDALDVTSVHGLTGIVGSISIGLFATLDVNSAGADGAIMGEGLLLGKQIAAVCVSIAWSATWTAIIMLVLKHTPGLGLRVSSQSEEEGLDRSEHGAEAYIMAPETKSV